MERDPAPVGPAGAARAVDRRLAWRIAVATFAVVAIGGCWWAGVANDWKRGATAAHAYGPTVYGAWVVLGPLLGAAAAVYAVLLAGVGGLLGGRRRSWLIRLALAAGLPLMIYALGRGFMNLDAWLHRIGL